MLIVATLLTVASAEVAAQPIPVALQDPAAAVPTAPGERRWTGSVNASANVSSGNTDKTTLAAGAQAENKGEEDRWSAQLLWNYADEKGQGVTERRTYAQLKYDSFLDEKLYAFGVTSLENNYSAALDLRLALGVGVGYQFRDDKEWKISGEGGLSYVDENFDGSADDTDYLAARLAYKADTTMSETWSAGQWGELFQSVEEADDTSARLDTHARVNLSKSLFAQAQWIYSWDNTPATGADRVDNLWLISLGWSF